jgi:hypothetical protein
MKRYLTPESQALYDIIQKIGSLTVSQIELIDTGHTKESSHSPLTTIRFLNSHNYITFLNDTYVLPFLDKQEKRSGIACFWAMLELIKDADGNIDHSNLDTIIEGNGLVEFSYIHNSSRVVNFVYLDQSYLSKITMIKQRFYSINNIEVGHEKDAGIVHIFVTGSPEIAVEASELDIKLPHKIALLEGDLTQNPTVKFFD